ncbi:lysophospholipid transporter LplT [Pelosinus sp. sgz500959]|uniref:lysophospholipid transporter LplT n=1 Tax=Pelosinus sp. sgz500959 TaxID=3242472 RepID=UPI00366F7BD5
MIRLSPLKALFTAQFLSAFVDNMILFIALGIIKRDAYPDYYLPFVQSIFLSSYIVFSPWVGRFADKKPKAKVLIIGNMVKTIGVLMLLCSFDPALSYGAVGVGAVIYSPAKYGILPFLTRNDDELLRANSGLEGYTIVAILLGSVVGGILSDFSITLALLISLLLYGLSIGINSMIPHDPGNRSITYKSSIRDFFADLRVLLANSQSHYSLIGTGSFWLASAVLRMILFAWAPLTLGITSGTSISMIIAVTGVGIAVGAVVTPYLISIKTYQRTLWFGYVMALCILAFLMIHTLEVAVIFLLLIGVMGGIYIVPMNSCLQQVGQHTVGEGKTIAVQNFVENLFMFFGVGLYTLATKNGVTIHSAIGATGVTLLLLVSYMYLYSRRK